MLTRRFPALLPLLTTLSLLLTGCTLEQYTEFRGTLAHDTPPTPTPDAVHHLGGSFSYFEDNAPDVVTGFHLGADDAGYLVFTHDRPTSGQDVNRPTDANLTAVYYANTPFLGDDSTIRSFFHLDPSAREQFPGVHRLHGTVHVERWKSNADFRIRLDMHTTDPAPTTVQGFLTIYDRLEPNPFGFIAGLLMWLGLGPA